MLFLKESLVNLILTQNKIHLGSTIVAYYVAIGSNVGGMFVPIYLFLCH